MSRALPNVTWPDGEEFDANRYLFVDPPSEIGHVRIATSTLFQSDLWRRHLTMLGMSFRHHLGYIGENGIAFYRCEKSPENVVAKDVLLFEDAEDLFSAVGREGFEYYWKDPLGRVLFRYQDELPASVPQDHAFYFMRAAENEWTNWLLNRAVVHLENGGSMKFKVLGGQDIAINLNGLLLDGKVVYRMDLECFAWDMARIELVPSHSGFAKGMGPVTLHRPQIANSEALVQLMAKGLHIEVRRPA
jgi:hypothetical protein